jgi:hypothetical protein
MFFQVRVCGEYCNELFDIECDTPANAIRQAMTKANQAMRRRSSYRKILAVIVETMNGNKTTPHIPKDS